MTAGCGEPSALDEVGSGFSCSDEGLEKAERVAPVVEDIFYGDDARSSSNGSSGCDSTVDATYNVLGTPEQARGFGERLQEALDCEPFRSTKQEMTCVADGVTFRVVIGAAKVGFTVLAPDDESRS